MVLVGFVVAAVNVAVVVFALAWFRSAGSLFPLVWCWYSGTVAMFERVSWCWLEGSSSFVLRFANLALSF